MVHDHVPPSFRRCLVNYVHMFDPEIRIFLWELGETIAVIRNK